MTTADDRHRQTFSASGYDHITLTEKGELAISDKLDEILAALKADHAPVRITMKRSSTKDAGEGFDVDIRSDATIEDLLDAFNLAVRARRLLQAELAGDLLLCPLCNNPSIDGFPHNVCHQREQAIADAQADSERWEPSTPGRITPIDLATEAIESREGF